MPKSVLALKLTNKHGKTFHRIGTTCKRLKVGMLVERRNKHRARSGCCGPSAVHAYRDLMQAWLWDHIHCGHGASGVVWLVRLYSPKTYKNEKLYGTSYKVLRKLGRLGRPGDVGKGIRREVSDTLKGKP